MSAKDSQFIERALVHPWMFWVFFWKWPRILRQVCGEYDLVAKDRDAAKAAHEQAVAANEKVRKWIHVTHQLDATADLRAIWTAGKRLSILLVFLVVTNTYGQAPPYLRNQWTTNANPLALKVISTNGVHAATNVWELDFTNTATVTVSAVSNANKVMVSFTGSGGSGESLWTNTGPFTALIADTNLVRIHSHKTVFGSNDNNNVTITNGSVATIGWGQETGGTFADSPGNYIRVREGALGSASFSFTTNCFVNNFEGGMGGGFFYQSSNCFTISVEGGVAGISSEGSRDCNVQTISGFGFGTFNDTRGSRVVGSASTFAVSDMEASSNIFISAQSPCAIIGGLLNCDNVTIHAKGGISSACAYNSRDISVTVPGDGTGSGLAIGSFRTATNSTLSSLYGIAVGQFIGQSNSVVAADGLAFGSVASNERILAQGNSSVAAFALGRNVVSTNNWTFGIHGTNATPFSLALVNNGVQFQVESNGNLGTIRGVSGYSWPTAHAAGALTNNGSGGLGWQDITATIANGNIWTNDGTAVMIAADTNRVRHSAIQSLFGTNMGFMVISNGGISGTAHVNGSTPASSPGSYTTAEEGSLAGAAFVFSTNCFVQNDEAGFGGGWFDDSMNCHTIAREGGFASISTISSTNCSVESTLGGIAYSLFFESKDSRVVGDGGLTFGSVQLSTNVTLGTASDYLKIGNVESSENVDLQSKGVAVARVFESKNITVTDTSFTADNPPAIAMGDFQQSTNSTLFASRGIGFGIFSGTSNSIKAVDGIAFGVVTNGERILSKGSSSVAAFAFGRDVASTNNWTFGIHYTNTVPLSLAVGANGTTQFRAASNSVVIRTETAPTVGQILTATDTSGTVGWSNAPAASGGGIASIYTNNVLAGGPGLTELEFTNTSSVTWTATTNAGRVTMSATSAAGAQTPWASDINAAAFSLTNFNELALTNGMRVQQPAANVLTITNGQLQIWSGASNRVALLVTNAETLGTHTALAEFTAPKMSNGSVLKITGTWQNDNIHFPAALLVDMTQVASGSLTPLAEFRVGGSPFHSFKRSGVYDMAGSATIANSSGALTLTHANGDDVRVKSAGATPALGFYNSSTVFQGNISPTAQGTLTVKTNLAVHQNLAVGGGLNYSRFATNGNVTMLTNFYVWGWTANAVLGTLTLPLASTSQGIHFIIKDEGGNASATNITIAVQSGDRIDGATTSAINVSYGAKNIYSAGSTNWFIY